MINLVFIVIIIMLPTAVAALSHPAMVLILTTLQGVPGCYVASVTSESL